jgi:hypothetical protein
MIGTPLIVGGLRWQHDNAVLADGLPAVAVNDARSDGFSNRVAVAATCIRSGSGVTSPRYTARK